MTAGQKESVSRVMMMPAIMARATGSIGIGFSRSKFAMP